MPQPAGKLGQRRRGQRIRLEQPDASERVGARVRPDLPRRLRHVRVDSVKSSGTCFPKSWRQEMRRGIFGAPVLLGPRTFSVRTYRCGEEAAAILWYLSRRCSAQPIACDGSLTPRKPHVLSLAILLPTAEMILSSAGDSVVRCPCWQASAQVAGRPAPPRLRSWRRGENMCV